MSRWLHGVRYSTDEERVQIEEFYRTHYKSRLLAGPIVRIRRADCVYANKRDKQTAYRARVKKARRRTREEQNRRRRMKRMEEQIEKGRVYARSQLRELRNWQNAENMELNKWSRDNERSHAELVRALKVKVF